MSSSGTVKKPGPALGAKKDKSGYWQNGVWIPGAGGRDADEDAAAEAAKKQETARRAAVAQQPKEVPPKRASFKTQEEYTAALRAYGDRQRAKRTAGAQADALER